MPHEMEEMMDETNPQETKEEEITSTEETSEWTEGEDTSSDDNSKTDLEEEVDELDQILASIEESDTGIQAAADDVKTSGGWEAEVKTLLEEVRKKDSLIEDLRDSVTSLQAKVKTLNLDKSDLVFKNAELEAFGGVQDPQLMIVVRNYEKAKAWDEWAKWKIKSIISDIWSGIYGTDIEKEAIDSDIDAITEVDSYISKRNPNVKSEKETNGIPVL